ncbi:MAG: hypothetical protein SAK29_03525 [Scytonema sp. PMC 1069.18]|nr:hypothetical protein [Scytonema sp. PMC 1069.18]MEC4881049.1 hypothetical protein [Scytonema sp. PMC 1070.18]
MVVIRAPSNTKEKTIDLSLIGLGVMLSTIAVIPVLVQEKIAYLFSYGESCVFFYVLFCHCDIMQLPRVRSGVHIMSAYVP